MLICNATAQEKEDYLPVDHCNRFIAALDGGGNTESELSKGDIDDGSNPPRAGTGLRAGAGEELSCRWLRRQHPFGGMSM